MRQLETAAQEPIEMLREDLAHQQDQQPEDGELGRPSELLGKRGIEDIGGRLYRRKRRDSCSSGTSMCRSRSSNQL
jgi:hypothetical protein